MAQLSIIVPVYNVEQYLPKCLDSVLAQNYNDFELILINDGSPDNCASIIDDYAKKDKRIITIHQTNKGVSSARNAGLNIAKGKYIGFVDPDDFIEPDMFEELVKAAENSRADIVCCNFDNVFENGDIVPNQADGLPEIMTKNEFTMHIFDIPRTIWGITWNKLFLREKITNLYDENLSIGEDWLFLVQYCLNIEKACYIDKVLYHYLARIGSATNKSTEKMLQGLAVRKKTIDLLQGQDSMIIKAAEADYLDSCYSFYNRLKKEQSGCFKIANKHLCDHIQNNFLSVLFNKKIYWKTKFRYLFLTLNNERNAKEKFFSKD